MDGTHSSHSQCLELSTRKRSQGGSGRFEANFPRGDFTEAESALERFAEKWNEKYPSIPALWLQHWDRVIPFFDYPADIRKVIYTTSTIESVNRALRKVLKTKSNMDLSSIPAYETDLKATLGPSGCEILEQSIIKQAKTIKEKARIIFENFMRIVD